jgi:hypothetical protein
MKKMKFGFTILACAGIMLGVTGCSDKNSITPDEAKAVLRIAFSDYVPTETKAIDNHAAVVIQDAYVVVLNDMGGVVNKFALSAAEISTPVEKATTTSASKVYVLGNVGTPPDALAAVSNEADLKAVVAAYATLNASKIWLQGSAAVSFTGTAVTDGTSPLATLNVTLSPIPARIDVNVTNSMTNWTGGRVVITGVAVLYSAGYTHFVPSLIPTTAEVGAINGAPEFYLSGVGNASSTWATWESKSNTAYSANLAKAWASSGVGGTAFSESFYALPGNAAYGKNTIVAVYGTYDNDGNAGTAPIAFYWPAAFSSTDLGRVLENGKWYTLSITLTGDANGGGGGSEDPEDEVIKAYIKLTITTNGWGVTVPLNKEIG